TTLVTRLMWTTCSKNSLSRSNSLAKAVSLDAPRRLELQSFFAGGVGYGLHLAVVDVATAVEDHPVDALLLRPLRHLGAHELRGRLAPGPRGLAPLGSGQAALHLGVGR